MKPMTLEESSKRMQYQIEICDMALNQFGITAQTTKCIEELSEFQVELAKTLNFDHRREKFIDELVDAEFTLLQMKLAYLPNLSDLQEYEAHKRKKIKALEDEINLIIEKQQQSNPDN